MRKVFLFCALFAGIAIMAGCQKEQDGIVTLKAVIDEDSKAHIGMIGTDYYPFWDNTDKVRINGSVHGFSSISNTFASITGVASSTSYFAVFPNSIVTHMHIPQRTANINLPFTQVYKTVNGNQIVDMPMAAYIPSITTESGTTASGTTLYFKNLCSVLRVNVTNGLGANTSLGVKRIVFTVDNANICGDATAEITADGSSVSLTMPTTTISNKTITLTSSSSSGMGDAIQNGLDRDFDIVIPPFNTTQNCTIRVETTSGQYQAFVKDATLGASKIVTLAVVVNNLHGGGNAHLQPGPNVNAKLRTLIGTEGIGNIIFRYETPTTGLTDADRIDMGVILPRPNDYIPIYAFRSENMIVIQTTASYMYANPDCSYMFADLKEGNEHLSTSSFDEHFVTDLVTDMSWMFAQNTPRNGNTQYSDAFYTAYGPGIKNIAGIESFNTSNVTTMAHMFDGNIVVTGLDLSHFNTESLLNMEGMFKHCTELTSIDMAYSNTSHVTTMKDLFNGCEKMQYLYLNNFDMTSVINKTDMCLNLNSGHNQYNPCHTYCPSSVHRAMSNGTSIVLSQVEFNDVVVQ